MESSESDESDRCKIEAQKQTQWEQESMEAQNKLFELCQILRFLALEHRPGHFTSKRRASFESHDCGELLWEAPSPEVGFNSGGGRSKLVNPETG